jgi:hypothetical protein
VWRPAHGLTAQQYQAGFNAQAVQGFYPICVQLAHNSHERPSKGSYFLCDAAADITWHVLSSAAREMGMRDTAYIQCKAASPYGRKSRICHSRNTSSIA